MAGLAALAFLWQPCAGGARVLRVLGDTPCPTLPAQVAGLPVAELGPYCFAAREPAGGTLWPPEAAGADLPAICGDFVEEVALPAPLRVVHSAAFYNCRRLRRVTLGAGVESLGSDLFTNCKALTAFALRAAPDAATGLKKLLGAVSADIAAEFWSEDPHARTACLFYPEYMEYLDENTPAHIFNHSIEGEGYRLRQCFTPAGAVDYAAYDAAFAQTTVGEEPDKLCRMALGRLLAPFALGDAARDDYEFYLTAHADAAFGWAITGRDAAALRLLVGLGLPVTRAAAQCARANWTEGAALLLGRAGKSKKTYTFF